MTDKISDDGGRPEAVTLSDIIGAIENSDKPVWSAPEVAEHFSTSRPTAKDRLKKLADAGELGTQEIGRTTVYYRPEDPSGVLTGAVSESHRREIVEFFEKKWIGQALGPATPLGCDEAVESGERVHTTVRWPTERQLGRNALEFSKGEHPGRLPKYQTPNQRFTEAAVTGTVYFHATTPITHIEREELTRPHFKDESLPGSTPAEHRRYIEKPDEEALIRLEKEQPYLFEVASNAVFLENVEVTILSRHGDGRELAGPDDFDTEELSFT